VAEARREDVESVDSMIARARSLLSKGSLAEAEELFQLAVGISNDRRAWQGLALLTRQKDASHRILRLMSNYVRQSRNDSARREAARAIGITGIESTESIDALLSALHDKHAPVRAAAAESLSKVGKRNVKVVPALVDLLQDNRALVRSTAAVALGKLGDRTAIPNLRLLADDRNKQVVNFAAEAIKEIEASSALPTEPVGVFLSYSFKDREAASQIYTRLVNEGIDPWMDIFNIDQGVGWTEETTTAIGDARVILLILSRGPRWELESMIERARREQQSRHGVSIVPARLEDFDLEDSLFGLPVIDLFKPQGWPQLLRTIREAYGMRPHLTDESTGEEGKHPQAEITFGTVPGDPWKGQFGGQSISNWRRLSATAWVIDSKNYQVELTVSSTDPSAHPLRGEVKFYLNPDYAKNQPIVNVGKDGKARVLRITMKPFTVGALMDSGSTRLELDLRQHLEAATARSLGKAPETTARQTAAYTYACYFSYTPGTKLIEEFVDRFHQALSQELELLTDKPIYFDRTHLKDFEDQLATAMAQSACYIVFCAPASFNKPFARRELEAMKRLEEHRNRFQSRFHTGSILPVILRHDERMPEFLQKIQWIDFEPAISSGSDWLRGPREMQQLREVAEFVYQRCLEADRIPEAFADSDRFRLPSENDLPPDVFPLGSVAPALPLPEENAADLLSEGAEHLRRGENAEALAKMERALQIYETRGDLKGQALAQSDLGEYYDITDNPDRAERRYQRALEIAREATDLNTVATVLDNLGLLYARRGEPEKAEASYYESLELFDRLEDKAGMAAVQGNLGLLLLNRNDTRGAIEAFDQQRSLARESGSVQREGIALSNLGNAYARRGLHGRAREFHDRAFRIFERIDDRGNLAEALHFLAQDCANLGQLSEAAGYAERAIELYARLGATRRAVEARQLLASIGPQREAEGLEEIAELASEYDQVRKTMTRGSTRTIRMEEIVEEMRPLAPSISSRLQSFANNTSAGLRLAAVVILQELPDANYLDWLAERLKLERPFLGHQAALALLNAVRRLDAPYTERIGDAIAKARHAVSTLRKDADRVLTLERADRELRLKRTGAEYYDPDQIKEIGRRLQTGTFSELEQQLRGGETLVGVFLAPNGVRLATLITDEERLKLMESRNSRDAYYAVLPGLPNEETETERQSAPRQQTGKNKTTHSAAQKSKKTRKKKPAPKRPTRKK
jgi:tetratricopeptide (TPR) repeat protein